MIKRNRREIFLVKDDIAAVPNRWDVLALMVVLALVVGLAWTARQMASPYYIGQALTVSLSPSHLPEYAMRTVLRIFIALIFSFLFTFIFGAWAAKSPRAERIIIPLIDILQSVPVLGFLSITVVAFIELFPDSLLGPECASIFVIFTAQAWNMVLSFYQSLRTLPPDMHEAADMFHLTAWQRFWRIEVPFAMPGLLWNTMLSLSASWFFVVFSEAITVANQKITLPGIGSYIALAIAQANLHAVFYAIFAMLVVIILYDQVLFRPLIKWSEQFKLGQTPDDKESESWVTDVLQRTQTLRYFGMAFNVFSDKFINFRLFNRPMKYVTKLPSERATFAVDMLYNSVVAIAVIATVVVLARFIFHEVGMHELLRVLVLGSYTTTRVFILVVLCSLLWVPIGVWVGMRPRATQIVQPIAQILAAFPANLLYPLVVVLIVTYHLNVEIWVTPLMILGSQWYVLFNVIAGAAALPKDLRLASANFGVKGLLWWRRFIIPAIFPYYVTGAITAAGGAWNASIAAEVVSWGHTKLVAHGLGAYITQYTTQGDFPRIALGIGVMCLYVLVFNRVLWRPLYRMAEERFSVS